MLKLYNHASRCCFSCPYAVEQKAVFKIKTYPIIVADTFWKKYWGLINKPHFEKEDALLLVKCNSIHTMFMKYSIDVIFLDKAFYIIGIENRVTPWKVSGIYKDAYYVLEVMNQDHGFKIGENISWLPRFLNKK
jgi:uncharacterized membrane protein (UPF0127 family)